MKLTKQTLQKIIKEELDRRTIIQDVANWMTDYGVYTPEEGIEKWWKADGHRDYPEKEEEIKTMLLQNTDEIQEKL